MKKIATILIVVFLFIGCSNKQDNDFALKESCAKYIKDAEGRYEGYEGTFYSKGKSTCVSVYWAWQDDASGQLLMRYYDEFTGQLRSFNRKDFEMEKQRLKFQEELELAW